MTADDLEALIGPPAPDRVRVVMGPRGPQPPRVAPEYRAWLSSPAPAPTVQPVSGVVAAVAVLCGVLALVAALLLAVAL